jgi:putative transposase
MSTTRYKQSAKGVIYHIFNRGNRKQRIFIDEGDFEYYLQKLYDFTSVLHFSVIAYCLMPNHVHLIVRQNENQPPAVLMHRLHTTYAKWLNKKYEKTGHIFQGRYGQKIIGTDEYLHGVVAYVHHNPVKDSFAAQASAYRWSSFREHTKGEPNRSRKKICDAATLKRYGLIWEKEENTKLYALSNLVEDPFDDD